jgi:hypothetical protein
VRPTAGQWAVLLPVSPCQTIVGISGAGGGPAVLDPAEQSTLVTQSSPAVQRACSTVLRPLNMIAL